MKKEIILSKNAPAPIGPYSQAVKVNGTLYMSGQIPIDPATGELVNEDVAAETKQVMENIGAVLAAAKMDFTNVVKCTIFIRNMAEYSIINGVYGSYFNDQPPARETVQVSKLPKDVNVEISCIAVD